MKRAATVYVRVFDDAVDAWRAVRAVADGAGFRLTGLRPADERWEFDAGDIVRCELRMSSRRGRSGATPTLVAVERLSPATIAFVGGGISEVGVCFAVYGEDLEPDAISQIMGRPPTSSHRRGDRRGPHSPPSQHGAWLFQIRGTAPRSVDDLLAELADAVPRDAAHTLRERFDLQIRIALHVGGFNEGFELSPAVLAQLAALNVPVLFDVYAESPR